VTTERIRFDPRVSNGASAVAHMLDTGNALSTAGALLLDVRNNGVSKFKVDYAGKITATSISCSPTISSGTSAPATTPTKVGDMFVDTTGKKIYVATGVSSSGDWTIEFGGNIDLFNPYQRGYFVGTIRPYGHGNTSFLLSSILNNWSITGTLEAYSEGTDIALVGIKSSTTAGSSVQALTSSGRSRFYSTTPYNKSIYSFIFRNSDDASVANARFFVGLYAGNGLSIGNVNPSTLVNCIGFGSDTGDTNIQLIHNDATGTATKFDLGVNFPANTQNVDTYTCAFFIDRHNSKMYAQIERINTGHVSDILEVTTNLFNINSNLDPYIWRNNGTTALEVKMRIGSFLVAQKSQ